ncbi:hypothetical protein IC232_11300 [Microvirga sp. BT688]|uniref:hypothetical protein n=1 Tax=Microvirga sp. TaxID=1873136 RepID=UPI00168866EA|nr:hypothetical protein [Microvirga sp.]MBD2747280.1 hypothetical protein [Microvirga sp.]
MVIVYPVAALIGGLIGCALLWPYGAVIAVISMPFIGSLFALFVAVLIYVRSSGEGQVNKDRPTDVDPFQSSQAADSYR